MATSKKSKVSSKKAPKKALKKTLKKPVKLKKPAKPATAASKKPTKTVFLESRRRLEIVYRGRVQGVGFRFNAEQAALCCGVTGWVRNEPNGDVKVVAEGTETCLNALLDAVRKCPVGRHIVKEQIRWEACRDEFSDFRIEYHF